MTVSKQLQFWGLGLAVFAAFLFVFSDVLLPFIAGIIIAYLLDPMADKLEAKGMSRSWATITLTTVFALLSVAFLVLVVPIAYRQSLTLASNMPTYIETALAFVTRALAPLGMGDAHDTITTIKDALATNIANVLQSSTKIAKSLWSGSMAIVNLISLLVITPVVTFYLVREWNVLVSKIDHWLPRGHAETIRKLAKETDKIMSAFIRGQITVCLILAAIYGVGLTLVGLDGGLLIGGFAGLVSFIPYVGSAVGLILGVGLALMQFSDLTMVAIVASIFIVGQMLESNYLTPKMVGDKVGLHPVWVIFALLGGGAIMGLPGMMLAVPVAATIGVVTRFSLDLYLNSTAYNHIPKVKKESA